MHSVYRYSGTTATILGGFAGRCVGSTARCGVISGGRGGRYDLFQSTLTAIRPAHLVPSARAVGLSSPERVRKLLLEPIRRISTISHDILASSAMP